MIFYPIIHQSDNASRKLCQKNSLAPAHKTLHCFPMISKLLKYVYNMHIVR